MNPDPWAPSGGMDRHLVVGFEAEQGDQGVGGFGVARVNNFTVPTA